MKRRLPCAFAIILLLIVIMIHFIIPPKTHMQDAEFVYESNKCWITVINNGEVLNLSDKQINKLIYLMEHSYSKTYPCTGAKSNINKDKGVYVEIRYENDIDMSLNDIGSEKYYKIIFTFEDKLDNALMYYIKDDSFGYAFYLMPKSDMEELERILNIHFLK